MTNDKKRGTILVDTETHMMPALAREMVRCNHNLVIGNIANSCVILIIISDQYSF